MLAPARRRRVLLGAGIAALALVTAVIAASSDHYTHGMNTASLGGTLSDEGDWETLTSAGGVPAATASSSSYETRTGWLHALALEEEWLWAVALPDPIVVGSTGTCDLVWYSIEDGDFEITLGEDELDSGTCDADVKVTSEVLGVDLAEDAWSEVVVTVTPDDGDLDPAGLAFRVYYDSTGPSLDGIVITKVEGTVDPDLADPDAEEVKILIAGEEDDTAELDSSGGFSYSIPEGVEPTAVTVEIDNKLGRTVRRTADLEGTCSSGVSVTGRTILWTSADAEAEIDFEVTAQDDKGQLSGQGAVRVPTETGIDEYDVTLTGKLDLKGTKDGHKLKITLVDKETSPKVEVKIDGYVKDGVVTGGDLKIKIKGVWAQEKWWEVTFSVREDNGNPIAFEIVRVAAEVEDGGPSGKVTVTTGDGTFAGTSPVAFTETLEAMDFASTITADDDASPANRHTETVMAVVTWSEAE